MRPASLWHCSTADGGGITKTINTTKATTLHAPTTIAQNSFGLFSPIDSSGLISPSPGTHVVSYQPDKKDQRYDNDNYRDGIQIHVFFSLDFPFEVSSRGGRVFKTPTPLIQ